MTVERSGLLSFYVEGVRRDANFFVGNPRAFSAASLGVGQNKANYFAGSIDELRLWNRVLTKATFDQNLQRKVTPLSLPPGDLELYLDFNEGVGSSFSSPQFPNYLYARLLSWLRSPLSLSSPLFI